MHLASKRLTSAPVEKSTSRVLLRSPQNEQAKLKGTGERMIRQLEEKFKTIFEKTRETIERRNDLILENENLKRMISDESQNQEKISKKYKEEIENLVLQNNELLTSYRQKDEKDLEYEEELQQKNKQISELSEQMKNIMEDLGNENSRSEVLEKQIQFGESEIQQLRMKINDIKKSIEDQNSNLEKLDIQLHDIQSSVKELLNKNNEVESYFKSIQEEQENQEERYKSNLQNYRALLKKYNANVQKKQIEEKNLDKLKEELASKKKRLDIILINNHKLEKKIKKIEELEAKIERLAQENHHIKIANEKLKKKIIVNMHSDYEKPVFADKQGANQELIQHAKKQQKLKMSKVFADEDKLISHISHNTKNGVISQKEEEYIKQKDAQNEENFKRILEIKELERLKQHIHQQNIYIEELEKNISEREVLAQEQKKEINSLNENLRGLDEEILQFENERDTLEKEYNDKKRKIDELYVKYENTLASLPEHLRSQLQEINENDRIIAESPALEEKPARRREEDQELEELLSKNPQTLEIKKR